MEWALMPFRRYAGFSGRSRRKEYWMFALLLFIVSFVLAMIEIVAGLGNMVGPYGPLTALFTLVILVPGIAVSVRRLHDLDRTGWWLLLPVAPYLVAIALLITTGNVTLAGIFGLLTILGSIVILIFHVLPGTNGPNRFGPDPLREAPSPPRA